MESRAAEVRGVNLQVEASIGSRGRRSSSGAVAEDAGVE